MRQVACPDSSQREGYRKSWGCRCMELEYQDAFQGGRKHVVLQEEQGALA